MTPELKTACEVVFQEHKTSAQPVKWSKDAFRGQISIGLSELAKETLVKKNIIILPNKAKKIITQLNPAVAGAGSFEEAVLMIGNTQTKIPITPVMGVIPDYVVEEPSPVFEPVKSVDNAYQQPVFSIPGEVSLPVTGTKWYLKPLFYYFLWPACALVAGAALTFLINRAYTEIFWHSK